MSKMSSHTFKWRVSSLETSTTRGVLKSPVYTYDSTHVEFHLHPVGILDKCSVFVNVIEGALSSYSFTIKGIAKETYQSNYDKPPIVGKKDGFPVFCNKKDLQREIDKRGYFDIYFEFTIPEDEVDSELCREDSIEEMEYDSEGTITPTAETSIIGSDLHGVRKKTTEINVNSQRYQSKEHWDSGFETPMSSRLTNETLPMKHQSTMDRDIKYPPSFYRDMENQASSDFGSQSQKDYGNNQSTLRDTMFQPSTNTTEYGYQSQRDYGYTKLQPSTSAEYGYQTQRDHGDNQSTLRDIMPKPSTSAEYGYHSQRDHAKEQTASKPLTSEQYSNPLLLQKKQGNQKPTTGVFRTKPSTSAETFRKGQGYERSASRDIRLQQPMPMEYEDDYLRQNLHDHDQLSSRDTRVKNPTASKHRHKSRHVRLKPLISKEHQDQLLSQREHGQSTLRDCEYDQSTSHDHRLQPSRQQPKTSPESSYSPSTSKESNVQKSKKQSNPLEDYITPDEIKQYELFMKDFLSRKDTSVKPKIYKGKDDADTYTATSYHYDKHTKWTNCALLRKIFHLLKTKCFSEAQPLEQNTLDVNSIYSSDYKPCSSSNITLDMDIFYSINDFINSFMHQDSTALIMLKTKQCYFQCYNNTYLAHNLEISTFYHWDYFIGISGNMQTFYHFALLLCFSVDFHRYL